MIGRPVMKVKAATNFAGEICMTKGEVRDVPERVAAPLVACGYLEPAVEKGTEKKKPAKGKTGD